MSLIELLVMVGLVLAYIFVSRLLAVLLGVAGWFVVPVAIAIVVCVGRWRRNRV